MTHLENWPDMERWFERFGKLHKIDADQDIDTVYNEMKRIFEKTFEEVSITLLAEKLLLFINMKSFIICHPSVYRFALQSQHRPE